MTRYIWVCLGASPEFEDLVARLLDKNPATRIGWDGLPGHPFWQAAPLPLRDMPEQPLFEQFIKEQGLRADSLPPTLHPEVWREIMQASLSWQ